MAKKLTKNQQQWNSAVKRLKGRINSTVSRGNKEGLTFSQNVSELIPTQFPKRITKKQLEQLNKIGAKQIREKYAESNIIDFDTGEVIQPNAYMKLKKQQRSELKQANEQYKKEVNEYGNIFNNDNILKDTNLYQYDINNEQESEQENEYDYENDTYVNDDYDYSNDYNNINYSDNYETNTNYTNEQYNEYQNDELPSFSDMILYNVKAMIASAKADNDSVQILNNILQRAIEQMGKDTVAENLQENSGDIMDIVSKTLWSYDENVINTSLAELGDIIGIGQMTIDEIKDLQEIADKNEDYSEG